MESSEYLMCDIATEKDLLGFEHDAEETADFLTSENIRLPLTFYIVGPWGSGKSSFMKRLKEHIEKLNKNRVEKIKANSHFDTKTKSVIKRSRLLNFLFQSRKKYFTVWFNSWRYEKEDELGIAFVLNLIEQLSKQLSFR